MKGLLRWISNFTAGLLFFTAFFVFFPKILWSGHKKWSVFVLLLELALIWFIIAAIRAIIN
jgi:hypothetical protein